MLSWHQWNVPTEANNYVDVSLRGIFINSVDATHFEIYGFIVAGTFLAFVLLKTLTKIFEKKAWAAYTISGIWAAACTAMYLVIYIIR